MYGSENKAKLSDEKKECIHWKMSNENQIY